MVDSGWCSSTHGSLALREFVQTVFNDRIFALACFSPIFCLNAARLKNFTTSLSNS